MPRKKFTTETPPGMRRGGVAFPDGPVFFVPRNTRVHSPLAKRAQLRAIEELLSRFTVREIQSKVAKLAKAVEAGKATDASGNSLAEVPEQFAPLVGLSYDRLKKLSQEIYERWRDDDPKEVGDRRARALRRLYADAERARAAGNHAAIARFEELIAKLEGTNAPIKVSVDQRTTVAIDSVIRMTDPEELARRLAQRREERRKALLFDQMSAK